MRRHLTWEADLGAFISANASRQFKWGEWDCALFAASAVDAMTGVDVAADFRGKYDSQDGARKALREIGKGTLLKTYQSLLPEKIASFAQRGDLIWNGFAVGVCMGPFAIFIGEPDGEVGFVRVPPSEWKRAFEVPFR